MCVCVCVCGSTTIIQHVHAYIWIMGYMALGFWLEFLGHPCFPYVARPLHRGK